jgi:membrane protein DedA with SNARE-associated domain/membrane-associated phospholipid phosphatase
MEFVRTLVAWIGAHPQAAAWVIGIVAMAESLAFVGLIVPGALLMFAAGALIANGTLPFWPLVVAGVLGAILGDGLSFWLGRRYRDRVRELWPFAKHPELLERGERFFRRHGGASVVFGRFVGPIRPIIPIVAGMLGMPPGRFYLTNFLSALAWAPGYLLPGIALGASLSLAGEVAGRLAVLLGTLIVAVWAVIWLVRALFRVLQPHAAEWGQLSLDWARRHRGSHWLIGDLLDPSGSAPRALLLWMALLFGGTWVLLGMTVDVVNGEALVRANQTIYQMLQALRTPFGDRVMIVFSEIGDWPVTTATTIAALAWLVWRRAKRDAIYWLTAIAFAAAAVFSLKLLLRLSRPIELYSGADAYSFPSGHATMSVVIYGYLAVLGAHDLPVRWRWLTYAGATVVIGGIGFSRLYLGAHWLSDVAAGFGLGLAGVAVIAIARERHVKGFRGRGVLAVAVAALVASLAWHMHTSTAADLTRYAVRESVKPVPEPAWWEGGWASLPGVDLHSEREQPMNVQWSGRLGDLDTALRRAGWIPPIRLSWSSALRWLAPNLPLPQLPPIPRLHEGRAEALTLILPSPDTAERELLLRFWPSQIRLEPGERRLWIGTVTWLERRRLPLIVMPRATHDYDDAAARLRSSLGATDLELRERRDDGERGHVALLIRPRPGTETPSR